MFDGVTQRRRTVILVSNTRVCLGLKILNGKICVAFANLIPCLNLAEW